MNLINMKKKKMKRLSYIIIIKLIAQSRILTIFNPKKLFS